jgi:phospholipase/carboxylesterase
MNLIKIKTFILSIITLFLLVTGSSMNFKYNSKPELLLHYIYREPIKPSARPPLMLILHGQGTDENDLFSMAKIFPDEFMVASARAPYVFYNTYENIKKYQWYDSEQIDGKWIMEKSQFKKSAVVIPKFIQQLVHKYELDSTNVFILGFSQGGIMAYAVGLTKPNEIRGIAVLSGKIPEELKPMVNISEDLKKLNVFITHGIYDTNIEIGEAVKSVEYVKQLGIDPVYKEYPKGHIISAAMRSDLLSWLNQVEKK